MDRQNQGVKKDLVKMIEVGVYWRQIKGRFGASTSRTYLAMKYGYRWLNRIKIKKGQASNGMQPLRIPRVTESVTDRVTSAL